MSNANFKNYISQCLRVLPTLIVLMISSACIQFSAPDDDGSGNSSVNTNLDVPAESSQNSRSKGSGSEISNRSKLISEMSFPKNTKLDFTRRIGVVINSYDPDSLGKDSSFTLHELAGKRSIAMGGSIKNSIGKIFSTEVTGGQKFILFRYKKNGLLSEELVKINTEGITTIDI